MSSKKQLKEAIGVSASARADEFGIIHAIHQSGTFGRTPTRLCDMEVIETDDAGSVRDDVTCKECRAIIQHYKNRGIKIIDVLQAPDEHWDALKNKRILVW